MRGRKKKIQRNNGQILSKFNKTYKPTDPRILQTPSIKNHGENYNKRDIIINWSKMVIKEKMLKTAKEKRYFMY